MTDYFQTMNAEKIYPGSFIREHPNFALGQGEMEDFYNPIVARIIFTSSGHGDMTSAVNRILQDHEFSLWLCDIAMAHSHPMVAQNITQLIEDSIGTPYYLEEVVVFLAGGTQGQGIPFHIFHLIRRNDDGYHSDNE